MRHAFPVVTCAWVWLCVYGMDVAVQVFLFSNWRAFRSGGTFDKSEAEAELQPHLNTMLRQELAHYTTAGIIVAISEAERMCACAVQRAACLCWCWRCCCCCTFWLRGLTVTCHACSLGPECKYRP